MVAQPDVMLPCQVGDRAYITDGAPGDWRASLRLFEDYNYFCAGMSLLNVSDRIGGATQLIMLIDHRRYLSRLHQFA